MGIFSRKSKGKKDGEKKEDVVPMTEEVKPEKQPYKHIPKHAAADSLGQGGRLESAQDIERITVASQMRRQNSMYDSTLANASYAQEIALNMAIAHGSSTPSSYKRSSSNAAFTTTSSDYFSPVAMRPLQANDPSLGYTKVAIARQDLDLAQNASDSGYESAGPSRVPSEHNLDGMLRQHYTRPIGGLRPEPRLMSDDARSERSFKSATKKTRFQVDAEPAVSIDKLPSHSVKLPALEGYKVNKTQLQVDAEPAVSLEKLSSHSLKLTALEGYKVNKKGKVLDEEGDIIGELIEGDLLDCVRQKVNANGEVLDDVGRVVGTVRLVAASPPSLTTSLPPISTSLPSLTAMLPMGGLTDGDSSPTIDNNQLPQDNSRRSVRSASERSLSELSKSYARPPMSSVPENNVPEEDGPPQSPKLFAYRGEIPDGPHQHAHKRSSSPPYLSVPASALKPSSRSVSSGGLSSRSPGKQPVGYTSRRRPTSSYDYSPNGSDDGTETSTSEDGGLPYIGYKRPSSVRSSATVPASKPRTYFTHAGRITVDPNAPTPVQQQPPKPKAVPEPSATSAPVTPKEEKKKHRLSVFGKK